MSQPPRTQPGILKNYQDNIASQETSIQKLKKKKKILALARLITVVAGMGIIWYFWPQAGTIFLATILISIVFIALVFRDADNTEAIKNLERLIAVNKHETDVLQHNLKGYEDGQLFADATHAYAADLELFGPSSLYQYLSRCHADQSKKLLADYLKSPAAVSTLKEKQGAVKELSEKQESCQQFQSLAIESPLSFKTERKLKDWSDSPSAGFEKPHWKWIQNLYPIIPLTVFTIYILDYMSNKTFVFCLIGFYILYILISKKMGKEFEFFFKIEPEVDAIYKQLHHIEYEKYTSSLLQSLQNRLKPSGYSPPRLRLLKTFMLS